MSGQRDYECQVEWCDKPGYAKGYCKHHYYQLKKHGQILGNYIDDCLRAQ
jgi:hypothetical protein